MSMTLGGKRPEDFPGLKILLQSKAPIIPEVKNKTMEIAGAHGLVDFGATLGPRQFELVCVIVRADAAALQQSLRALAAHLLDGKGRPKTMQLIFDEDPGIFYNVRVSGAVPVERMAHLGQFTIPLIAYDPFGYATVETVSSHALTGAQGITVNNPGGLDVKPVIELKGFWDSLALTLGTDTLVITEPGTGDTIIIDCGKITAKMYNTNILPGFSQWTLHENTRMKQTNFIGKIGASTVENPNVGKYVAGASLIVPSSGSFVEETTARYASISTLNGTANAFTNTTSTYISQQLFSFNLIEHVIRTYGVGVFGTAVTTAERVAWLKVNVAKLIGNWHGYGSGPSGNKAYLRWWGGSWQGSPSHTSGTVALLQNVLNNTDINALNHIDANGVVHYLVYSDASNGTIASTINTDFVELEVYMAAGSIPQDDFVLTLNATAANQESTITVDALPNTQYTFSFTDNSAGAYGYVLAKDAGGTTIGTYNISAATVGVGVVTFTTPANTASIKIALSNTTALGSFAFSNPELYAGIGNPINIMNKVGGQFLELAPGNNSVAVAGAGFDSAKIDFKFKRKYI